MAQELARIAYEAAARALDKQEGVLEELRSRTSILLAASRQRRGPQVAQSAARDSNAWHD